MKHCIKMMTQPVFGWFSLLPIVLLMIHRSPVEAGGAAAIVGGLMGASTVWSRTLRALLPLSAVPSALGWGVSTWVVASWVPKPWFVLAFPLAMIFATLPLRLAGAPRFISNPLARTQESWLLVVHTARFGGDLVTTATLATASASVGLAFDGQLLAAAAGATFVVTMLALGGVSLWRAIRAAHRGRKVRVAAVVVDGKPRATGTSNGLWPAESPEYRDIRGTLERYRPHIEHAVSERASLVVLPEVSVYVENEDARAQWLAGVESLARELDVVMVAPFFDGCTPKNTLVVVDRNGIVGSYDKQYPARGLEPACPKKMEVGPYSPCSGIPVSTAICVDLDHPDIARSARMARSLLAAPSNDWFDGFEVIHHRSAVWTAVIGGVPIVRATGHGISSIYDSAGRVLMHRTSAAGPVVLVGDIYV